MCVYSQEPQILRLRSPAAADPLRSGWHWSMTFRFQYALALLPLSLALLAIAAPYLLTHGFPFIAIVLQRGFALVCHQRPERSFEIFGAHTAVCARCLGIYLGAAVGTAVQVPRRTAFSLLVLAAALNLADAISAMANLHGNWIELRFVLGVLLGFAAAECVGASARSLDRQEAPS